MRSRYWCFTDHNVCTSDQAKLRYSGFTTRENNIVSVTYLVIGLETCPTTGKRHLQGYLELSNDVTLEAMIKHFPGTHWEKRFGTAAQASDYCKKEGHSFEVGSISQPVQGARHDLDDIRAMAIANVPMSTIVEVASSFQAIRMAEKIREYTKLKRTWKTEIFWYHGPTGTGKTRIAFDEAGPDCWISNGSLRFWNGYDGQENVIFDDFRADFCPLHVLLQILDRYPLNIEIKGGHRSLMARKIWITCPYSPRELYAQHSQDRAEDINQLLRRIEHIRFFGPPEQNNLPSTPVTILWDTPLTPPPESEQN